MHQGKCLPVQAVSQRQSEGEKIKPEIYKMPGVMENQAKAGVYH